MVSGILKINHKADNSCLRFELFGVRIVILIGITMATKLMVDSREATPPG